MRCNHKLQLGVLHHRKSSLSHYPACGANMCWPAFMSCQDVLGWLTGRPPQVWTCKWILLSERWILGWSLNPTSGFFMIMNCREFLRGRCPLYSTSATRWVSAPAAGTISRAVFIIFSHWGLHTRDFLFITSSSSIMGQLPHPQVVLVKRSLVPTPPILQFGSPHPNNWWWWCLC